MGVVTSLHGGISVHDAESNVACIDMLEQRCKAVRSGEIVGFA